MERQKSRGTQIACVTCALSEQPKFHEDEASQGSVTIAEKLCRPILQEALGGDVILIARYSYGQFLILFIHRLMKLRRPRNIRRVTAAAAVPAEKEESPSMQSLVHVSGVDDSCIDYSTTEQAIGFIKRIKRPLTAIDRQLSASKSLGRFPQVS